MCLEMAACDPRMSVGCMRSQDVSKCLDDLWFVICPASSIPMKLDRIS